jgi:SAM-dependent methyltransferase
MTTPTSWCDEAFFTVPEPNSLDGGTTSAGTLWHGISPRWGHSMHTMCSYHGMFPAKVAHYFIQSYSRPGDVVLDPFSGRGTVPLQARVEGRKAICNDLSPLAFVLSTAKVQPPTWDAVMTTIDGLERQYRRRPSLEPDVPPDIRMLYHPKTLRQICFLRSYLLKEQLMRWFPEDAMIAGALAGIMHGSFRRDGRSQYLSISMPNTFSMSPSYVEKYIREKGLVPPDQDVFSCIRDKLARLYLDEIAGPDGRSVSEDAPTLLRGKQISSSSVDLIVTSPPYLQVVNYGTSNWIRLWLLGLDEVGRERGAGRRTLNAALDHQHTYSSYREFLMRVLQGVRRVLKPDGVAVIIIGDVADPGKTPIPLAARIWEDLSHRTDLRLMGLIEDHLASRNKVSRIWGETRGQATNRDCALILTRKHSESTPPLLAVDWDEPYKDAGPDAAHARLDEMRYAS